MEEETDDDDDVARRKNTKNLQRDYDETGGGKKWKVLKLRESPMRCTFFFSREIFLIKTFFFFSLPPSLVSWIFFTREKKGNSFSPLHFPRATLYYYVVGPPPRN